MSGQGLDFPKIQIPRDSRGWPIPELWKGGDRARFKKSNYNRSYRCGCGYRGGSYMLDSGCTFHINKIVRVAEYDKKRRIPPLWRPSG